MQELKARDVSLFLVPVATCAQSIVIARVVNAACRFFSIPGIQNASQSAISKSQHKQLGGGLWALDSEFHVYDSMGIAMVYSVWYTRASVYPAPHLTFSQVD